MKKFSENTSTIQEVMDSSTLNFNPVLSFRDFFSFFLGGGGGGGGVHLRVSASSLGQSLACVNKNFGAQHPLRAEIESLEKSPLG